MHARKILPVPNELRTVKFFMDLLPGSHRQSLNRVHKDGRQSKCGLASWPSILVLPVFRQCLSNVIQQIVQPDAAHQIVIPNAIVVEFHTSVSGVVYFTRCAINAERICGTLGCCGKRSKINCWHESHSFSSANFGLAVISSGKWPKFSAAPCQCQHRGHFTLWPSSIAPTATCSFIKSVFICAICGLGYTTTFSTVGGSSNIASPEIDQMQWIAMNIRQMSQ